MDTNEHEVTSGANAFPFSGSADSPDGAGHTRRQFIAGVTVAGAAIGCAPSLVLGAEATSPRSDAQGGDGLHGLVPVKMRINGVEHAFDLDPRVTLLDLVREHLGLTGTKKGCDHGQCGACTVLVGGRRINSCLALAVVHDGDELTTVEGLSREAAFQAIRDAFLEQDAFQCGFCTSGQLCSAVALIREGHANADEEIREWMSGNLCRCGAYTNIVAAVREASGRKGNPA